MSPRCDAHKSRGAPCSVEGLALKTALCCFQCAPVCPSAPLVAGIIQIAHLGAIGKGYEKQKRRNRCISYAVTVTGLSSTSTISRL
jgi:heterodisulfide reductase subunit C